MSEEMKQSFPNPICPYCGMNMKSGDGSWWCMNKTCHEQFYPYGIAQTSDWKEGPAQTGEAKPVQQCDGMPHYYCTNPSCQWVAHFKPVERKCPKCGSIVWKEGATTLQHKSVPLCEAAHAPSSSAREYESAEDWYIRMGFCVTQRVFGLVEVLELANRYAAERQRRG